MSSAPSNLLFRRRRHGGQMLACACVVALWLCNAFASAQESAKDFVEPRLNRTQFTMLYRQLGLDANQRIIAESIFTDYAADLDALTQQLDAQATQAGLRTVQDAMSGKVRVSADELRQLRVDVLRVYQKAWPVVDNALSDLLLGLESILTAQQAPHFEPALRQLHRDLYLHPRQAGRDYQEYAGDGVDVLLLVEQAMNEGGELQTLDPASLANILAAYEMQLDALLVHNAAEHRNSILLRKIAGIEKDPAAIAALERDAIGRWKELFQLNQSAVQQIAQIAEVQLGEAARQQWLDRFDHASFTWLYPRKRPDRQIEWMRRQTMPAEKMEQAQTIYDGYIAQRRELSRQAIEIMLRGRLEFQTMLYSMMDPARITDGARRSLYEELLKNTGEQANLESSTAGALEALVDGAQREEMRRAMQRPDSIRNR